MCSADVSARTDSLNPVDRLYLEHRQHKCGFIRDRLDRDNPSLLRCVPHLGARAEVSSSRLLSWSIALKLYESTRSPGFVESDRAIGFCLLIRPWSRINVSKRRFAVVFMQLYSCSTISCTATGRWRLTARRVPQTIQSAPPQSI